MMIMILLLPFRNRIVSRLGLHCAHVMVVYFLVQLWHSNNYHWYLKQEKRYFRSSVAFLLWDPEIPYRLHVMTSGIERKSETIWYVATTSPFRRGTFLLRIFVDDESKWRNSGDKFVHSCRH